MKSLPLSPDWLGPVRLQPEATADVGALGRLERSNPWELVGGSFIDLLTPMKGDVMSTSLRTTTMALALFGSAAFLGVPAFAIEPDVDSPAGPELPAPRADRPDFQRDDQTGAVVDPREEGADPTPPRAEIIEPAPLPEPMPER